MLFLVTPPNEHMSNPTRIIETEIGKARPPVGKRLDGGTPTTPVSPGFDNINCSQCGRGFGPGNHGFSHCKDHRDKKSKSWISSGAG